MNRTILALASLLCCSAALADDPAAVKIAPTDGPGSSIYGPILYDPSGNIMSIGNNTAATSSYIYDPMGRLTSAQVQRAGHLQSQSYTYDVYGNRTAVSTNSSAPVFANVGADSNRLLSATYDAAGNLTQWTPPGSTTARQYTYDSLNMVTRETAGSRSVTHIYTADDERYWSLQTLDDGSNKSDYTLRDLGGKVLRHYHETPNGFSVANDYLYRNGLLLASVTPTGTHHYSLDHLGTPRIVTNQSGHLIAEHTYYPFGVEITDNSPSDGLLKFTGHERDADLLGEVSGQLDYMHARYYSANRGRFLSVDPEAESAELTMPQSWNRYSYALNNPMRYIDSTGRVVQCVPADKEGDPPICSEVIEVEGEEPEVEPEPQQAGMLPFLIDMWDSVQHEAGNLKHLTADDFSFDHAPKVDFGQCIEDNSFSNVYTAAGASANALLNKAVGDTTRTGISGIPTHPTTWQNKAGRALARQARRAGVPGLYHKVHRAGRFAGRAAVVLTVFEGFYDIGTIGRCGALAASR